MVRSVKVRQPSTGRTEPTVFNDSHSHTKLTKSRLSCSHLVSLFTARYHDDDGGLLLPDHPPEVAHGFLLWPYGNTRGLVTL